MHKRIPPKSVLHREIIVTYLVREKEGQVRFGFPAQVIEFLDHYKLNASQEVRAMAVSRKADPSAHNIRMFFRVGPSSRDRLRAEVYETEVNLLDISLGGVRFSYEKHLMLKTGTIVPFRIIIDGKAYSLEGTVLRVWDAEDERPRHKLRFASVRFQNMSKTCETAMSRKIRAIEIENRFGDLFT